MVHNGIIENYLYLKNHLIRQGVEFASDTDTEVVAQLLEYYYKGDVLETMPEGDLQSGGLLCSGYHLLRVPGRNCCAVRKDSPLICRHWPRGKLHRLRCAGHLVPHPGYLPAGGQGDCRFDTGSPSSSTIMELEPASKRTFRCGSSGTLPQRKRAATSTS